MSVPSISIEPVDFALPDLAAYGWIVFTSVNGVHAFFDRGLAQLHLAEQQVGQGAEHEALRLLVRFERGDQ